ncbi:MAG: hypothetical protein HC941_05555 [Microcoleus sp. SU_5_3]|nr:hypothetical protein [Microcoleus sp. SU_5_3]
MTDQQFPNNNQESAKELGGGTSITSAGKQEPEQKPDDDKSITPAGKQESEQKPDDDKSITPVAYQEQRRKADDKGFSEGKYSSEGKFRNPFVSQETKQKDESKYSSQSSTEEKSKYSNLPTQLLETWKERYKTEIGSLKKQYDDLSEKIEDFSEEKREAHSLTEERRIQKKLDRFRQEREEKRIKLEQLENDLDELDRELSKSESEEKSYGSKRKGANENNSSEESEDVVAQSLFADDDLIQNTVLYVATFFPGLNLQDFKRVVSLLLAGQTKTIPVKESTTTEEGKIQVKETQKEKLLTEIWQESFDRPDKYLKNCYLTVSRQNGNQSIDFTSDELRKNLLAYFEKEQSLYLEEQLRRTQKLDLLLDSSDELAEKAIDVAVKAAIDYPNSYAEDWLIELLVKIAKEDERRVATLLERLSQLIYKLQIQPDYSKSENIAQKFLEHLIDIEYRSLAFAIFSYLIDWNIRSGELGIRSGKQLLTWLKKLLDREDLEEKNEKLQADIYSLLKELLWQSGFYLYIYDFLGILKEWLPDRDISAEQYTRSNITALFLLFTYCEETIDKLSLKWYGEWPSFYPLFAPLRNQDNSETGHRFNEELGTLFSWLFYSDFTGKIAIDSFLDYSNPSQINALDAIGFFIAEWLVILFGFDGGESDQEVLDMVNNLIHHIILNTSRSQQNQLKDFWTSLTGAYLDNATEYNESGNRKLKEQFSARRKILKKFQKQFKASQKETKTAQ